MIHPFLQRAKIDIDRKLPRAAKALRARVELVLEEGFIVFQIRWPDAAMDHRISLDDLVSDKTRPVEQWELRERPCRLVQRLIEEALRKRGVI